MDFLTYHIVVNWDPFSDILYSSILGFQARSIHPKKCVSDGQIFLLLPSSGQVEVEIESLGKKNQDQASYSGRGCHQQILNELQ